MHQEAPFTMAEFHDRFMSQQSDALPGALYTLRRLAEVKHLAAGDDASTASVWTEWYAPAESPAVACLAG
jgi:hypothetical protein